MIGEWHGGIDPVQLEQIDALDTELAQTPFALRLQSLGPAVGAPLGRRRASEAGLGGDHQMIGIRVQRFANQFLADVGAVGIGCVDEIDPQLHRASQHAQRLVAVGRRPPYAVTRELHRAEPQSMHRAIAEGHRARTVRR